MVQDIKTSRNNRRICALFPNREVPSADNLINPSNIRHLTLSDVIELDNERVFSVAQVLWREGFGTVGDILDNMQRAIEVLRNLDIDPEQLREFVEAMQNPGIVFTEPEPLTEENVIT